MFLFFDKNYFLSQNRSKRHDYIEQQKVHGGLLYLGALSTLLTAAFFTTPPLIIPILASIFTLGGMMYSLFVNVLETNHFEQMDIENDANIAVNIPGRHSYSCMAPDLPRSKQKDQATHKAPAAQPSSDTVQEVDEAPSSNLEGASPKAF